MIPFMIIWLLKATAIFKTACCNDGNGIKPRLQGKRCGRDRLTSTPGEIHNPDKNGDYKYDHNSDCVWTISAEFDKVIEIDFYYMDLEESSPCEADYVQVYDGEIGDFLMGQFCGTTTPGRLTSTGNVVTIRFKTDATVNFYGFGLVFFERNEPSGLRLCGPVQNSLAGTIASVDGESNGFYDDDVTCTWKINFPDFDKKIQLYFLKMTLEVTDICQGDFVKVSDAKEVYGVFCGSDAPQLITSTANDLFIEFVSNNETHEEGFLAVYAAIDGDLQCGAIVTEASGYIVSTDRDGDGEYDVDLQCVWAIAAPIGTGIELNFTDIDIESDDECLFETIELFDGSFTAESSLGRICDNVIPVPIKTASNLLFLEFYSDEQITYRGFNVSYQHITGQKLCGPFQMHQGGHLVLVEATSDQGINCTWKIDLSKTNKVIELYLRIFDILATDGCTSDHVKVYDADTTYGIFCGTNETHTIISTSNVLNVHVFKAGEAKGHEVTAYYSTRDPDHQCGGILSSPTGIVRSVDRDQDGEYDPDLFCVWGIIAPPWVRIKLEITDFGLEPSGDCHYDYLKIVDGVYKSASSTEELFCGNNAPKNIPTSNTLFLVFVTDGSTHDKGFLANYSFIDASEIPSRVSTTEYPYHTSTTNKGGTTDNMYILSTIASSRRYTTTDLDIDITKSDDNKTLLDDSTVSSDISTTYSYDVTSLSDDSTASSDTFTTYSYDVTSLSGDRTALSDTFTTYSNDVITLPDDAITLPDDGTSLSNHDTISSSDVTTLSDDITTLPDRVITSSDDVTALLTPDNVTSSLDETIGTMQTSSDMSTARAEIHTSVQTLPKTMEESSKRTEHITTSKEMISWKGKATVHVTSDTSPTMSELVTETNGTSDNAMSHIFLQFLFALHCIVLIVLIY